MWAWSISIKHAAPGTRLRVVRDERRHTTRRRVPGAYYIASAPAKAGTPALESRLYAVFLAG